MAALMSFYAEKCCHLVDEYEASARRLCSQFLIYITFVALWLRPMTVQRSLTFSVIRLLQMEAFFICTFLLRLLLCTNDVFRPFRTGFCTYGIRTAKSIRCSSLALFKRSLKTFLSSVRHLGLL